MNELTWHDLQFALRRCPASLLKVMKIPKWKEKIFIGGGFLRSIVAGEYINDIDIFVDSKISAVALSDELQSLARKGARKPVKTENAITLRAFNPDLQIIHRWVFNSAQSVSDSFDFTCCCAAFWWDGTEWQSVCDDRFYADVAAKRLIYRSPIRNEDAGGSALRVLKYYQKGYRIPLDSFASVLARLVKGVKDVGELPEKQLAFMLCGLLREVDPAIDPKHIAHLPAEEAR